MPLPPWINRPLWHGLAFHPARISGNPFIRYGFQGHDVFRFPLFIAITLIVAFGGGIMISLYALDATQGFGAIKLGAWEAFPALQTVEADPYAKSHRAR